jgi:hypothetical protein
LVALTDIEGDVGVDLLLKQGKVIDAENLSGDSELTAAVFKGVRAWQLDPIVLTSLHRVIRFKKNPMLADWEEHGTIVVTRGLEIPKYADSVFDALSATTHRLPESSWTARLRWCLDEGGQLHSVQFAFVSSPTLQKRLLDAIRKVHFKPGALRGKPSGYCGIWDAFGGRR